MPRWCSLCGSTERLQQMWVQPPARVTNARQQTHAVMMRQPESHPYCRQCRATMNDCRSCGAAVAVWTDEELQVDHENTQEPQRKVEHLYCKDTQQPCWGDFLLDRFGDAGDWPVSADFDEETDDEGDEEAPPTDGPFAEVQCEHCTMTLQRIEAFCNGVDHTLCVDCLASDFNTSQRARVYAVLDETAERHDSADGEEQHESADGDGTAESEMCELCVKPIADGDALQVDGYTICTSCHSEQLWRAAL